MCLGGGSVISMVFGNGLAIFGNTSLLYIWEPS
jgi:hypothetical protein